MKFRFNHTMPPAFMSSLMCTASNGSDMGGGGLPKGGERTHVRRRASRQLGLKAQLEEVTQQRNTLSGQLATMREQLREAEERAGRNLGLFTTAKERIEEMRERAEQLRGDLSTLIDREGSVITERDELMQQIAEMRQVMVQEVKHRQALSRAAAKVARLMESAGLTLNDAVLPLLEGMGDNGDACAAEISVVIDQLVLGFTQLEDAQNTAGDAASDGTVIEKQPRVDLEINWANYEYLSPLAREGLSLFGAKGETATQRLHTIYGAKSEEYVDQVVNAFWESVALLEIHKTVKNSELLTEEAVSRLNNASEADHFVRGFVLQTIRTAQLIGEGKSIHSVEVRLNDGISCPQWKLEGDILRCCTTSTRGQLIDAMAGNVMIEVKRVAIYGKTAKLLFSLLKADCNASVRPKSVDKTTDRALKIINQLYRYRAIMDAGTVRKLELHFTTDKAIKPKIMRELYKFFGEKRVRIYRYAKELASTREILPDGKERILEPTSSES